MGVQVYQYCIMDLETWTPRRHCKDQDTADLVTKGYTLASEWKVRSDIEELQCYTGPSMPNIYKAEIKDCELSANVTFQMYSVENGVIYELLR